MSFWSQFSAWWAAGDVFMPVMLAASFALYTIIGQRIWTLFGPASWCGHRRDDLEQLMAADRAQREWVGRCVAFAEEAELSRGFAIIRALTAALPLLGLLGTVAGMVDAFAGLGHGADATDARQASAGIGMALTATQFGICLAIPAVVCEWALRHRVTELARHRDAIAHGFVAEHEAPDLATAAIEPQCGGSSS
jgi:hypothetical protein